MTRQGRAGEAGVVPTQPPGRILLAQILPKHPNLPFPPLINRLLTKKDLQNVIDLVYRRLRPEGDRRSFRRSPDGRSASITPAAPAFPSARTTSVIPAAKEKLVPRRTQKEVKEYEQQYQDGLITSGEKYNKVVDAWSRCSDRVAERR